MTGPGHGVKTSLSFLGYIETQACQEQAGHFCSNLWDSWCCQTNTTTQHQQKASQKETGQCIFLLLNPQKKRFSNKWDWWVCFEDQPLWKWTGSLCSHQFVSQQQKEVRLIHGLVDVCQACSPKAQTANQTLPLKFNIYLQAMLSNMHS